MIEKLTAEQEEKIEYYKEKWIKIGLNTELSNREITEKCITKLYDFCSLKQPEFVWVQSPHAAQVLINSFANEGKEERKMEFYTNCFYSQSYAGYFGFYDFLINELNLTVDKKNYETFLCDQEITVNSFWNYAFEKIVVCVERPEEINMVNGRLHKDGGPSIKFRDGWSIWSLNGIRVPQWLAETKAEEIDPTKIMKEKNVEIRREILRKIGVERYILKMGAKVIDTFNNDYELLEFDIDGTKNLALKMKNLSLDGVYHIEGVPPEINTCVEALNWRNQDDELPHKIS